MMKISDLQAKDIVNLETGKRLGHLTDLDLNLSNGQIESIIISSGGKMMSLFGKEEEFIIPWSNIIKIGSDVILVKSALPFQGNSNTTGFAEKPPVRTTKWE
ncbi:YlmC/YmxH family sporulation protein [Alkalicoccobacillus porphyridii]|uniref:YlmC/YmxH family sporulation protein n=1 Tax=Alkalicoccobacillus porphyridii TaxID=2597270 RepID=A0A553ZY22_9BACI|nr:YlmC/YmxH family sporulation protein [Alkalicoccobacillus porphyridii]TSB46334.1 YlmC/YmxH family sporulation protein [Alkalicoccobacillus porphyridii]